MLDPESPVDRRSAILRAARLCFLDRGYVRTTISDIIALCGGSRATIYGEFGNKEGLFAALIASILDQMRLPDIADGPPRAVMTEVALSYMEQLMDPEALALYRVVLGESAHIRHLGPAIFAAGPRSAVAALADRMRAWADRGDLTVSDPELAAALFLAMVEGDLHRSAVMWNEAPSPERIASNIDAAVAVFLHGTLRATAGEPANRPAGAR
jgi:TetR/AcrR family transcriptional regulator, mexJK operon transcriptional repressor